MRFYVRPFTASATLLFVITLLSNHTLAQTTSIKKTSQATASKSNTAKRAAATVDADSGTPDITTSIAKEYKCELNDSFTFYTHQNDDSRAAIRWKNKLYGLNRVATTTGANRFENKKAGLVWIGIPTKAMLLDSIRGQQLTNECKTVL